MVLIMEERLKNFIKKFDELKKKFDDNQKQVSSSNDAILTSEERQKLLDELLIQISFFQHERLIHLIVTVLFALMTTLVMLGMVISFEPFLVALMVMLLVLLVPYIRHYYILENGVQKLYTFYDWLSDKT